MKTLFRRLITILLTCSSAIQLYAQADDETEFKRNRDRPEYATSRIPEALLAGASKVIRRYDTRIEVKAPDEVYETRSWVVTVINETGLDGSRIKVEYRDGEELKSIIARQYNKEGREVARTKSGRMDDNGYSDEAFFNDVRYRTFQFTQREYPMTYYFEVVKKHNSTFNLPAWVPRHSSTDAIETATLTIECPDALGLRYRTLNIDTQATIQHENGLTTFQLAICNKPAYVATDEYSARVLGGLPYAAIVVNSVALGKYAGNIATWNGLGAFVYNINSGRDVLPEQTKKTVHTLTDTCTTVKSKVNVLYKYLQQNTRYVLITLGIGGYQTMTAENVAAKGYGDCKALSNFMRALLAEVGINSNLVLIYGGKNQRIPLALDFSVSMFNHMIVCVPNATDTIWLECTDKDLPAGYLSSFTANRKCLVLAAEGGNIVQTPAYKIPQNRLTRSAIMTVDSNDQWNGTINMLYSGIWWEDENSVLRNSRQDVLNMLNKEFTLQTYSVKKYKLDNGTNEKVPYLREYAEISGVGNITHGGQRLFVSPKILRFNTSIPGTISRTDSFRLMYEYEVTDTTIINLPGNYTVEKLPADQKNEWPFGSYHSKTIFLNEHQIQIIVQYTEKEGVFAPELFPEFVKLKKILNNGTAYEKCVLVKKG